MTSKLAVNVQEAAEMASVPEARIWEEIAAGRLRSFKLGKRRLIRVAALDAFLERREALAVTTKAPRAPRQQSEQRDPLVPFPDLETAR